MYQNDKINLDSITFEPSRTRSIVNDSKYKFLKTKIQTAMKKDIKTVIRLQ